MRPVLIAGPTASGKSALAVALARRLGGVVVNADSQQVYREWRVLTARPSAEDEAAVPHRLYGHVGVAAAYSVGRWLDEVRTVLERPEGTPPQPLALPGRGPAIVDEAPAERAFPPAESGSDRVGGWSAARVPIVAGGTGLYFKALTEGLAPIPEVPAAVRAAGERELGRAGLRRFAARLAERDPETAAGLDLSNPRRVLRAWEVLEATGTGLAAWKARTPPPLVPLGACTAIALEPPRPWLRARCDARLDAMLLAGALDEVRDVLALGLPPDAPGLKAVGAAELAAHVRGEATLAEAVGRAKTQTRRYAKRQLTWMRNQMAGWARLDPSVPGATERAVVRVAG